MEPISGNLLLGGVSSILENIVNWFSTQKTNETNQEINQQNIDYNTAMTQKQWERDDKAHQREVADLQNAGLSPLAATNGANTSAALGAPNPIAAQAPQIDTNALINAALQDKALNETKRHNLAMEGFEETEMTLKAEEIAQKAEQLKIENKKVEETINYNAKYLTYLNKQIDEVNRHNQAEEELKKLSIRSEEYYKSIQSQTGGKFNYTVYKDYDKYTAELSIWQNKFERFINSYLAETSSSVSSSNSSNKNTNVGAGAGATVVGTGGNGNLNIGHGSGESSSASSSYNVSQKQQAEMDKWYRANPMPVYIYYTE